MSPSVAGSTSGFHHHACPPAPTLLTHTAARRSWSFTTNGSSTTRRPLLLVSICPSVAASTFGFHHHAWFWLSVLLTHAAASRCWFPERNTSSEMRRPLLFVSIWPSVGASTSGFHRQAIGS